MSLTQIHMEAGYKTKVHSRQKNYLIAKAKLKNRSSQIIRKVCQEMQTKYIQTHV